VVSIPNLLSPETCAAVISIAETSSSWVSQKDSVDGQPEWQHTIFDGAMFADPALVPLVDNLTTQVLAPLATSHFSLVGRDLKLSWAFVRSYSNQRRTAFPVHRDRSMVTCNILLTPTSHFEGAELFVLSEEYAHAENLPDKQFRRILPDRVLRGAPHRLAYEQGTCAMHLGKRLHGVLPLAKGHRHVLILMFEASN
jgi:hypothetical protein